MSQAILLSLAGTVILLLLGVNGYFAKNLVSTVTALKEVVTELRLMIETHKASTESHKSRLDDHGKRLKKLETDFAVCKATNKVKPHEHDKN